LIGILGFGERLYRQIGVRPVGQLDQPILQWLRQILDVATGGNGVAIRRGIRIRKARRRWLLSPGVASSQDRWH
jgi:hypothetical protein